jgi:uroporphyrinogen-III synthase
VLLAVAESAGDDVETAARAKGWTVERVHSYRTVAVRPTGIDDSVVRSCDAITFTAASAVDAWVSAFGTLVPSTVVAMGPQTARALSDAGIAPVVVATEQSLHGVVAALG